MLLNKSTRYALYAAMEMARSWDHGSVTVARVARRYGLPAGALAKVFQRLVHSGTAVGTRGVGGGYRLARPPSRLTVLDVIGVFEPPRQAGRCLLEDRVDRTCDPFPACRLRELFEEVDQLTRGTLQSVSFEKLIR
jgi:Rrf2 family protein